MGRPDGAVAGRDRGLLRRVARRARPGRRRSRTATPTGSPRAISSRWPPASCARWAICSAAPTEAGKRLATLSIDTEVRFRSAADRAAFSSELAEAVTKLVSRYHDESAPGGRAHRLVVVAHPLPHESRTEEPS